MNVYTAVQSRVRSISSWTIQKYFQRTLHYIQGQSRGPGTREYFYYVDHQGQLFLDDSKMKNFTSCFKEKKFLAFFFKRLKKNTTGHYEDEFPFVSPCGREMNYIRCDDLPVVFTQILHGGGGGGGEGQERDRLSYGGAGDMLCLPFEPERVCMLPSTGRIYHPCPPKIGSIGLIKSSIAIEISPHFEFGSSEYDPPTHFTWKGRRYELTNELIDFVNQKEREQT